MRVQIVRSMMLRLFCLFCLVSLFLVVPSVGHAVVDDGRDSGSAKKSGKKDQKTKYKEGEILIRFKKNVSKEKKNAVHEKMKTKVLHSYRHIDGLEHVKIPDGTSLDAIIEAYKADSEVLYAERNYFYQALTVPNDDLFPDMWNLHNTGQEGGVPDADINAPEAWDHVTGSPNTVVAVVDTGVDYNNLDLVDNIWVNPAEIPGNEIDDDGNGYVDDVHGINAITGTGDPMDDDNHGTHVAGTIAATGNNNRGIVGVNWQAKIIACKFLDSTGYGTDSDAAKCLDYFFELKTRPDNPVNIILSNNSWGGPGVSQALEDAIDAQRMAGILFITSAGNDTANNDSVDSYPADCFMPNVISVAATDKTDNLGWFSNVGRHSVHVAAPGVLIWSTKIGGSYGGYSGTSMAAPHASGLAALVYSQDPSRDWIAIKNLVISGGQTKPATEGTTISGKRIRAYDANGVGSLSCSGQVVNTRVQPTGSVFSLDVGSSIDLAALHINCASPNGDVVVTLGDGTSLTLMDDGQGSDAAAGDGIYSGQWLPPGEGTYTITFPGSDVVTVYVAKQYSYEDPIPTEYSYRTITGTEIIFSDIPSGEAALLSSPFPVSFPDMEGSRLYDSLYVSPYGTISFTDFFTSTDYTFLPSTSFQTLVAPLWTSLDLSLGGGVYWDVIGTEPNRELVVEWRDVAHSVCPGSATFQVVFFENSREILTSHQNLPIDDPFCFNDSTAAVGMQWIGGVTRYNGFLMNMSSLAWLRIVTIVPSAGPDQVVLPGTAVTLDGTRSFDKDGTIVSYQWEQTSGTRVVLAGADTAAPQFTAPDVSGTLGFTLSVTNDRGHTGTDFVLVVVNRAPTAEAGPDQTAGANGPVTLDGSGSSDPDDGIAHYYWQQTAGPAALLNDAYTPKPSFTAPSTSGVITYRLTAIDNNGVSASDTVSINVAANEPPSADAGPDQTVRTEAAVTLNGTASSDSDGTIVSYNWAQTAGTTVNLTGAGTPTPSFTAPPISGTLTFQLTVTDNYGATGCDTVNVRVNAAPIANAGPDQLVQAGAAVTLNGTASIDMDGTIASYNWIQTAGATVTLTGADTATPTFTAPSASGTLTFQLTVTDNDGATRTDTVNVSVNMQPVANAGPDQLVQAGAMVTLNGAGSSDPDGTIASYSWIQTAGTTVNLTGAGTATPTFTAPPVFETLTFQLTITDNNGATATDTVNVSVNLPPSANAGTDQLAQAGAAVSLNGSGSSDPDGTIASYGWTQTAGTTVSLAGAGTATPSFTAPSVSGTLTFQLTVTDNNGATATDTVTVSVNLTPVADAGTDQFAQAGAAVSLNGSGSIDPDGTIVSYNWVQTAGTTVSLAGAVTATPSFTAPSVSGTLTFQLTVTDNNGATATDTVTMSVNLPPVADADTDQLAQAGAAVILNGTGSNDPDGTIATYNWIQTAGSTVSLAGAGTATPSFTAPAVSGSLTFQLTVTDNNGATSTDTINVSVNLPPVANAGPDQLVKTRSIVTLNGAGSTDPDGTIVSFTWVQTAGTVVTLSNANSSTPTFDAPATTGTLTFQLSIVDNRAAVASDVVNIVVSKTGR